MDDFDFDIQLDGAGDEPEAEEQDAAPVADAAADDFDPDGEIEAEAAPADEDAPPDDEAETPVDDLAAIKAERDQLRAEREQAEREQRRAAYEADRSNRAQQYEAWFADQKARIKQEAASAFNPVEAFERGMDQLLAHRDQWYGAFHAHAADTWRAVAERQAIPTFAAQVAKEHGLPASAAEELAGFPPELMPGVAKILKRTIKQDQKIGQAQRSAAARRVGAVGPGTGRGSARPIRSLDDFLDVVTERVYRSG